MNYPDYHFPPRERIHYAEPVSPAKCGLRPNSTTPMLILTHDRHKVTCWDCTHILANKEIKEDIHA